MDFYRNDGLIIIDNCIPRKGDNRKKIHALFYIFGFKLDIDGVPLPKKKTINIHAT